jgi:hypothetical protein
MLGFGIAVPSHQPLPGDVLLKTCHLVLPEVKSTRKLAAQFDVFKIERLNPNHPQSALQMETTSLEARVGSSAVSEIPDTTRVMS